MSKKLDLTIVAWKNIIHDGQKATLYLLSNGEIKYMSGKCKLECCKPSVINGDVWNAI